jgi:rhodanese-related sulfurtransferase
MQKFWVVLFLIGVGLSSLFAQEKSVKPGAGSAGNPFLDNFFPAEAFLDSSYNVYQLLSAGKEIPVLAAGDVFKIFKEKSALFIDARGADEFVAGHIPGAINIPYDSVSAPKYAKTLSGIAIDIRIVVYCNTHLCIVSRSGAEGIVFNGFTRVIIAEGFWRWEEMGFPVERDGSK